MSRLGIKRISLLLLIIHAFSLASGVSASAMDDEALEAFGEASEYIDCDTQKSAYPSGDYTVSSRIYELLFGGKKDKSKELYLVPGGDVFGIKIKEAFVTVADVKEGSPFKRGDKILAINDEETNDADDVTRALQSCRGGTVRIEVLRGGEKMTLTVIPKYENGAYRLGITLRRAACGIGTVTFIDPESGAFGGLGHGVCESNGKLIELDSGEVTGVVLGGIVRGEAGKPGELSGVLNKSCIGSIEINDECGVFGVLESASVDTGSALPVGRRDSVRLGEAEIISTVRNGKKASYKIEITEIDTDSSGSKSFKIKVTDPTLIALTGGIVRGMSGSPIIQNGKLIGAVTHVMVANPTEGYGIFIENMLNSAQSQAIPKAA